MEKGKKRGEQTLVLPEGDRTVSVEVVSLVPRQVFLSAVLGV